MCGLVAAFLPGEAMESRQLIAMRDTLVHRGPDDAGIWQQNYRDRGSVNLAFRRLSILDVSDTAHQPMVSHDGKKVMVFNGEIYNYVGLRTKLEGFGYQFRSSGDSEVLLAAYSHWGHEFLNEINGMFAIVIWDEDRGEAIVARDRFGEKPLYMANTPDGGLVFGSEIKALFAYPGIRCAIDENVISKILSGHLIYAREETVFENVRQIKAAHKMIVSTSGQIKSYRRYWKPDYSDRLTGLSKSQIGQKFQDLLFNSVRRRARSDVPMTASLSGGLDSSSLVAILASLTEDNLANVTNTISARFPDDPTISEGPFIDSVLDKVGMSGYSVTPSAQDLVTDLRKMHWHQETVVAGMSMYLEWQVMQKARSMGYTVIIDGQGADELLAGYQSYFWAHQLDSLQQRGVMLTRLMVWNHDRRIMKESKKYEQAARRFPQKDGLDEPGIDYFRSSIEPRYTAYDDEELIPDSSNDLLRRELAFNLLYTSLPSNLFSGDRNSMAHSLECRYPFLDYELVDFCNKLPTWALISAGWQKYILRKTMRKRLPSKVAWRVDKVGFSGPHDKWLMNSNVLNWIEERALSNQLTDIPGYSSKIAEKYLIDHKNGIADYSSILWQWASAAEVIEMKNVGIWG
ncbi:MAG: asparagine synthase (glutamine-hydrolyzing) [Roseibium sp.]